MSQPTQTGRDEGNGRQDEGVSNAGEDTETAAMVAGWGMNAKGLYSWTVTKVDCNDTFDKELDYALNDLADQGHELVSLTFATSSEEKMVYAETKPDDPNVGKPRRVFLTRYTAHLLCRDPAAESASYADKEDEG